jgi:tetratricopeptide (TPR) repeat protein
MHISSSKNTYLTHRPSNSNITLITFAHAGMMHKKGTYWGKSFAEKHDLNCYAFTHNLRHWYPQKDVFELLQHIPKDRPVLVYGASMGGYAAVKFSAALNADYVLAFSPQYSINPDDLECKDKRFIADYKSEIHKNMAIQKSDIKGRIMLAYDPKFSEDLYNASRIHSTGNDIFHLKLPYMNHFTSLILSDHDFNSTFIDNIINRNDTQLLNLALKARRKSRFYFSGLAEKSFNKKQNSKALTFANRALEASPSHIPAHIIRARAATRLGNYKEAEDSCWQLVALSPQKSQHWMMLGYIMANQKKFTVANSAYAAAAELAPYNLNLYRDWEKSLKAGGMTFKAFKVRWRAAFISKLKKLSGLYKKAASSSAK